MRWGVRKAVDQVKSVASRPRKSAMPKSYSEDAKGALDSKQKLKSDGIQSLSNQELNDLVKRMKLEQQYNQLTSPANNGKMSEGKKLAQDIASSATKKFVEEGQRFAPQVAPQVPSQEVELYTPPSTKRIVGDMLLNTATSVAQDFAMQAAMAGGKMLVTKMMSRRG